MKFKVNRKNYEAFKNLPEENKFTELQWYDYHYYLKKNLLLLQYLQSLAKKVRSIYIIEPFETYLSNVLRKFGYEVECNHLYPLEYLSPGVSLDADKKLVGMSASEFDVIFILNAVERFQKSPEEFIKNQSDLLSQDGYIILTTENIAQFKNRIKLLFGRSIYKGDSDILYCSYRLFNLEDLKELLQNINLKVQNNYFISPYPPRKMEALSLRRYLLKYLNYYVMKTFNSLKNEILIEVKK